jgi:hypothetical protein
MNCTRLKQTWKPIYDGLNEEPMRSSTWPMPVSKPDTVVAGIVAVAVL